MKAERSKEVIALIRSIFSEFRHADKNFSRTSPAAKYIMKEMREHHLTQRVLCKAPNEMEHLAATYKQYLQSTRRLLELEAKYQSGERTIDESAKLVGLQLPDVKP